MVNYFLFFGFQTSKTVRKKEESNEGIQAPLSRNATVTHFHSNEITQKYSGSKEKP
jgi:hypothetical protein